MGTERTETVRYHCDRCAKQLLTLHNHTKTQGPRAFWFQVIGGEVCGEVERFDLVLCLDCALPLYAQLGKPRAYNPAESKTINTT